MNTIFQLSHPFAIFVPISQCHAFQEFEAKINAQALHMCLKKMIGVRPGLPGTHLILEPAKLQQHFPSISYICKHWMNLKFRSASFPKKTKHCGCHSLLYPSPPAPPKIREATLERRPRKVLATSDAQSGRKSPANTHLLLFSCNLTPPKTNVEPQNGGLEDLVVLFNQVFQVPC